MTLRIVKTEEKKWTTAAEDAKEIRVALKAKFPGVKFSVRSSSYSLGSSISVNWVDGPTPKQVEAVASVHEQIDRDHMTGEILSGGNRFVHCSREISERLRNFVRAEAGRRYGEPQPGFAHEFEWRVACATEVRVDGQILAWDTDRRR